MSEPHLKFQTKLTREGERDMRNRKPYRTASQKARAKAVARKDDDGTYRSIAPVSLHY